MQTYSFGKSSYNRLGHPSIRKNENVYEPMLIDSLKNVKVQSVSAGCRHAVAITDDGKMYAWGFNFFD